MATVRMSEAEVARDLHGLIDRVQQGLEVSIERNCEVVAVLRSSKRYGRPIDEAIASAEASGSQVTLDGGFAEDLQAIISERRPWNPPSWD